MKCQKCGKNEVNLHYSSNVNGAVTEAHLCSECAQSSGYDLDRIFSSGSMFGRGGMFGYEGFPGIPGPLSMFGMDRDFGGMFPMFSMGGRARPAAYPAFGFSPFIQFALQPWISAPQTEQQSECASCGGECDTAAPQDTAAAQDNTPAQGTSRTQEVKQPQEMKQDQKASPAGEPGKHQEAPQAGSAAGSGIDGEMRRRREINVLRDQMRKAARKEDFEKAAELRDRIKGMQAD